MPTATSTKAIMEATARLLTRKKANIEQTGVAVVKKLHHLLAACKATPMPDLDADTFCANYTRASESLGHVETILTFLDSVLDHVDVTPPEEPKPASVIHPVITSRARGPAVDVACLDDFNGKPSQ